MIVNPKLSKARFEADISDLLNKPEVFGQAGMRLLSYTFPILLVELRSKSSWHRLSVSANDFDYGPLDGHWIDEAGIPLVQGRQLLPFGMGFQLPAPGYCNTNWLCFPGWSAYHNHSSHQDTSWTSLRTKSEFRPLALLQNLQKELTNPHVSFL